LGQCAQMHADMQTSDMSILSPKRQRVISGDEKGQRVGNGTEKDIVDFKYLKAGDANAAIEKLKEQDASTRKPGDKRRRWDVMHKTYPGGGRRYQIIELPPSDPLDNGATTEDADGSEDESLEKGEEFTLDHDDKPVEIAASEVNAESTGGEIGPTSAFEEAMAFTIPDYSRAESGGEW
jgi:hypothetical protein